MSKTDAWLPLYVADYLAATTRLTTEQHGAYLLIIMDYWRNGAPPDDDVVLAQITRMTLARWKVQRGVIERFFQISGKCWQHKRIDAEMEKATAKQKARQLAGKLGGEAKANALANGVANAKQKPTPSPSPLPKTFTGTEEPSPETSTALSGKPDAKPLNGHKAEVEILAYLNEKAGRAYKPVPANIKLIAARLKEGATPEDIRAVVDRKCAQWKGDAKMDEYLRPATLFNATNFAQYQGQLSSPNQGNPWDGAVNG